MADDVTVTARIGPRVTKERFDSLDAALAAVRRHAATVGPAPEVSFLGREYAPESQVLGRVEVRTGRGGRGGVDVRGDGSVTAYTGRLRRRIVEPADGESAVEALGRALRA